MNWFIISALVVVLVTLLKHDQVDATSARDQIRQDILFGYDNTVHPENTVNMKYQVMYLECPVLDSATGNLDSHVHEAQRWTDERLMWDPANYHQIPAVTMSPDEVWTPGVYVKSTTGELLSWTEVRLSLTSEGILHRVRKLRIASSCSHQSSGAWKCQIRFVSWKYAGVNFDMMTVAGVSVVYGGLCRSDIKIEESSEHVEVVGGIGNSHSEYVIDLVIRIQ